MAGSVTITYGESRTVKTVVWTWTSDASGDVSGTDTKAISGIAYRFATNPDDSAAPSANYDIVINDADGIDISAAALQNRHTSTSEQVIPTAPPSFDGALSLVVSNAGNAKQGVLTMYYR